MLKQRSIIPDPNTVQQAIQKGLASIERGNFIELKDDVELKQFFADIISRGKNRLAAKKRLASRTAPTPTRGC